ncbi:MAG: Rieske (2Fe-2S) protein [Bacteroidetes bacterium]|nr:Rieske (2Fe-2S) protein [Bacteroidota bacterium]
MNRREVIRKVAMGGTTLVVLPAMLASCEKEPDGPGGGGNDLTIDLGLPANAALNNTGGFIVTNNIIVINTGSGNYTALSAVCTHAGCTVSYSAAANNLPCACHGSLFAIGGAVINGPATSPLAVYPVSKSGSILTITR